MPVIHHLDAGTMHPLRGELVSVSGSLPARVVVIAFDDGRLALIDTGVGTAARQNLRKHLGPGAGILRASSDPDGTAAAQLRRLGYDPAAVTDILITHLDIDHAAGLADFPQARVHVSQAELDAARSPRLPERTRYLAANWSHGPDWQPFGAGGPTGEVLGVPAIEGIGGLGIWAIPLAGHTRGHTGYALPDGDGWLVHAGDAYYAAGQLVDDLGLIVRRGMLAFEWFSAAQPWKIRGNHAKLRALAARPDVHVVCAHDPALIERV